MKNQEATKLLKGSSAKSNRNLVGSDFRKSASDKTNTDLEISSDSEIREANYATNSSYEDLSDGFDD